MEAAKSSARNQAKQNALDALGGLQATGNNGVDGKIEASGGNTLQQTQRTTTLGWLNAYNAPHWMQFFASIGSSYATTNPRLGALICDASWVNLQTGADDKSRNVFGTSWVFDLMMISGRAAEAQQRPNSLLFNGTGTLGVQLNLGINTQYISDKNQHGMYGDEWLLGLSDVNSVDLTGVQANNTSALAQLKYLLEEKNRLQGASSPAWDAQKAQQLADLLQYINRVTPAENNLNDQTAALKDFLSIYTATQNDNVADNGSLNEQLNAISSGKTDAEKLKIQQALFGSGQQTDGLINTDGVLLGGKGPTGAGVGNKLTAETLAAVMDVNAVQVVQWVELINEAITKFNINTPKRLAAFLANVRKETGRLQWLFEGANVSSNEAIDFQKLNFQKYKKAPFEDMLVSAKKKPQRSICNDNTKLLEINSGKTAKKPGNSTGIKQYTVISISAGLTLVF